MFFYPRALGDRRTCVAAHLDKSTFRFSCAQTNAFPRLAHLTFPAHRRESLATRSWERPPPFARLPAATIAFQARMKFPRFWRQWVEMRQTDEYETWNEALIEIVAATIMRDFKRKNSFCAIKVRLCGRILEEIPPRNFSRLFAWSTSIMALLCKPVTPVQLQKGTT